MRPPFEALSEAPLLLRGITSVIPVILDGITALSRAY
jgi:hypothetical protein